MDSSSYAAITSSPTSSSPLSSSLHEVLLRKEQCVGSVRSRSSRAKGNLPASSDTRSELRRRGGKFVSELRSTVLPHHSSAAAAADGDEGRRPTGTHQGSISCPPYPPLPPAYQDLLHEPRQEHQLLRSEVRDDSRPIRQVMTMTMPAAPDGHESLMTMPAPIDDYWAPALHSDPEPPSSAAAADADGSCPIISSPADCCSSSTSSSSQAELLPCCPPLADATTAHPSTVSSSGPSSRNHHSRRPTAKPLELSSPQHRGRMAGRKEESREYFLAKLKRLIEKADSHPVLRRDEAGDEPSTPISKCGRRRYLDPLLSRSDSQLIVAKISAANWLGIESNNYCNSTTMMAVGRYHNYHDGASRFISRPPESFRECEPMARRDGYYGAAGVSAADAEVEKLSRRADALMLSSSAAPARASTAQSINNKSEQQSHKRNIRGPITAEPSPHRRQVLMSPQLFSLEALNNSFPAEKGDEQQQSSASSYDESDEASRVMSQPRYLERNASHHGYKRNNSLSADGQLVEKRKVGHLLPSPSRSQPSRLQSRVRQPRMQHRPSVVAYQRTASTIGNKLPGKSEAVEAFVMDAWHPGTPDAALGELQDRVESLAVAKRCRMETEIWNFDPKPQTPTTAGERAVRSSWKEPLDQNGRPLRLNGLDAGCERTGWDSGFGSDGDDSSGDDSGISDDDSSVVSFEYSASGTLRGCY